MSAVTICTRHRHSTVQTAKLCARRRFESRVMFAMRHGDPRPHKFIQLRLEPPRVVVGVAASVTHFYTAGRIG